MHRCAAVVLSLLVLPAGLGAQTSRPAPCTSPIHRQFDFWLGEWEVRTPQGAVTGESSITSILNGCVVRESYVGQPPYRGESYNMYDARTKRWHQSWVDNGGLLALFDGELRDGAMVLEGEGGDPTGQAFKSRMTFTPLPDGRVRQHWQRSNDGGSTWTTMFDGYYSKKN
jgi:hypothetical protein